MTRSRIALIYAGVLVTLAVATWLVLRTSGVSRTFVAQTIGQILDPARFTLGSAQVDLAGGTVTLSELIVGTADDGSGRSASLRAERIEIGVGTNPLSDPGALRSVHASGVTLEVDLVEGRFPDLSALLTERGAPAGDPEPPPPVLIEDGELRIRFAPDTRPLRIQNLHLSLLPVAARSWQFAVSGNGVGEQGELLELEGSWDLQTGVGAAQVAVEGFAIDPDLVHRYHPGAGEMLANARASGRIATLEVHVARGEPGAEIELTAHTQITDLSLRTSELPYQIEGATAQATLQPLVDGGRMTATLEDASTDGTIRAQVELARLFEGDLEVDLEVQAGDVLVRPAVGEALQNIPEAQLAWDAFQPDGGRVDALVRFRRPSPVPGKAQQFGLEIDLHGVGARFVGMVESDGVRRFGFPQPLSDLTGRVTVRDGVVGVENVRASIGEGSLLVKGRLVTAANKDPDIDLSVEGERIAFSDSMLESLRQLDSDAAAIWEQYAPRGEARLKVDLRLGPAFEALPDPAERGVAVRIEPLLASASYAGFPVRVADISGAVEILPDRISIDLQGQRDGAPLEVRAMIHRKGTEPTAGEARFATEVRIVGKDIQPGPELDAALRSLGTEVTETLDVLGLRSGGDVDLHLWRTDEDEPLDYDLRVDLEGGRAELETLGLPFENLEGPVFVHGKGTSARIEIGGIRGRIAQRLPDDGPLPTLFVHGDVDTSPAAGPRLDVTAVVEGLRLTEEVGSAVDRYQAFDLESWQILDPQGVVDLVWRQHGMAGNEAYAQDLRVQLRGVRSSAPFLPAPAESLFGDLTIRDGHASIDHIRGMMAGAAVFCSKGSAAHSDGATRIDFTVSCPSFPIDDRLANVLEGPLRETYLAREPRGEAAVENLEFAFLFPDDRSEFETRIRGTVIAQDVAMTLGTRVEQISGSWTIDDSWFTADAGTISGRVANGSASVKGHRLTGGTAAFEADIDEVRFSEVLCRLHQGRIRGAAASGSDAVYRFAGEGDLSCALAWEGISLSSLLATSQVRDAKLRGNLSGEFVLDRLPGSRLIEAEGRGELRISDADLGKVPAFRAIYSYLERPRRPTFERLRTGVDIRDHRIGFKDLRLESPLLEVEGQGFIGMDGYVDLRLDFPDFFGKSADWTLIPQLVRMLSNQIVQFHLFGDLRAPKVEPVWLGQGTPGRPPLEPIPPPRSPVGNVPETP